LRLFLNGFTFLKLIFEGKSLFVKGTAFPVNPQSACFIANNKFLTKSVLRSYKIPIPQSWLIRTAKEAKKIILKKDLFPCVLKPVRGSHGNKVFANIESLEEFDEVLPLVFDTPGKKDILIEKFIKGKDYRLLVIGDKASAAMERIPAHIIGDGLSNIHQLIKKFNQNCLVGENYEKPLCKIRLDGEIKRNLKKQDKKLTYVPQKNEKLFLRQNADISTGGSVKMLLMKYHELKEIAIKAVKVIGMVIAGVDIIYDPLVNKPYILELNDCPGIDIHHFPVFGQSRKVASDIVEFLFKKTIH